MSQSSSKSQRKSRASKPISPKTDSTVKQSDLVTEPQKEHFFSPHTHKGQNHIVIVVSIVGGILVIIGIIAAVFSRLTDISSASIIDRFAKDHSYVTDIVNFTEETDPNGIMGSPHEYLSKSSWNDSRLESILEDYAGTIEVFRNTKDAEIREQHIREVVARCAELFDSSLYGEDFNAAACGSTNYGTIYRNGVVIVRLSRALSSAKVAEYREGLDKIINSFIVIERDIPSEQEIEAIKAEKASALNERYYESISDDIEKGFSEIADEFTSKIDAALASLDESTLPTIKENLDYLRTIPYFADKISGWQDKVDQIEAKIAEAEAAAKAAALAAKSRTLSAGKYRVGTDIDSGTYNIIATGGSGNLFIYNSSDRLDVSEMMAPAGYSGYYTERYNNEYLGTGYTIKISGSLTLHFEAVK